MEMMVWFIYEEVLCARKEIKNRWDNDVYEEVDGVGQQALSVR